MGLSTACQEDTDNESSVVELSSFGPTGVQHGEDIFFIGSNLNKVTGIMLAGVEISSDQFKEQTTEKIVLTVPDAATEGKVILKTTEGDIESKTILSFEVPVLITFITPEARPGANITIKGSFLNWVEAIWFTDELLIEDFVQQSLNEIVATVPITAKTGSLVFQSGGTEPLTLETNGDFVVILPVVTELTPNPLKHSDNLSIVGSSLDLVTEVRFTGGSIVISFVSQTEDKIELVVPNDAKSGTLILVEPSLVEVETTQEISIILPAITSLNPIPVKIGDNLTITGTDLDLVAEITMPGGISVTSFVSQSATEIVVTVPEETINGFMKFITIHDYVVATDVKLELPGDGPSPLAYALYSDALENGYQDWSGNADVDNAENAFDGSKAIKFSYAGGWENWGGGFWPDAAPAGSYTEFTIWTYGGTGASGKINMVVNPGTWDDRNVLEVVEGKWTENTFQMSSFTAADGTVNPATWSDIRFQAQGISGDVWFDYMGFR